MPLSEVLQNPVTPVISLLRLVDSAEFSTLLVKQPREHRTGFVSQTRLSPTLVDQLVDEYGAGASVYELQKRHGIHRTTVASHLKERGLRLGKQPLDNSEVAQARELHGQGLSLNAIGRNMGRDPKTVRKAIVPLGF